MSSLYAAPALSPASAALIAAAPFGAGLGRSTIGPLAAGDGLLTIHGTANWTFTPAGTREIALLLVDPNGNTEIVLPFMNQITHAAGDQQVAILRGANLPLGEVATPQTAKAFSAGSAVYQIETPGLIDVTAAGSELDGAGWDVSTAATVALGTANDVFARSTLIQNSQINPTVNGLDPMILEIQAFLFLSGTIGGTSKGVISIADITAGPPGAGAIEVAQFQTQIGLNNATIFPIFAKKRIGTPPAGTRTYACYVWGNTAALTVTSFGSNATLTPYEGFLRVVQAA